MEVGTVISWLKQQGDQVVEGEPIVEVEADKANHELEAPASGTLEIVAAEGDEVEVGGLLARIA
jgi:pyruvate dehydrogenase E2 component (dihydrolipoamide acetyltransferase)